MKWVLRIFAVLGGLILSAVLVLAAMSHRSGAGQFSTSIEIDSSPERIWPWLEDGEKAKQWVSWLVEVRKSETGRPKAGSEVGSKEVWILKDPNMGDQLIPVEGTCTEYTRPSRLSVSLASETFTGTQTYVLTPGGNGRTKLTVSGRYEFPGWFAQLMEPLVSPAARRKMVDDLTRLKTVVEAS